MRNTTKLKAILLKYLVTFDMDDDGDFSMTLIDKYSNKSAVFQAKNYSSVISKGYSFLLRELKDEESRLD